MKLPKPECESGYPWTQIEELFGDETDKVINWMAGQTMAICQGKRYNHDTETYYESCGGVAHGGVVYSWDLERYVAGLPVID